MKGFPKRGRGVEPEGANGLLWKARRDMKRMFEAGKLVRETIITDPTASKLSERQEGSQAPSSTAPSSRPSNKPQKEKDCEGIMSAQGKQRGGGIFPPAKRLPGAPSSTALSRSTCTKSPKETECNHSVTAKGKQRWGGTFPTSPPGMRLPRERKDEPD